MSMEQLHSPKLHIFPLVLVHPFVVEYGNLQGMSPIDSPIPYEVLSSKEFIFIKYVEKYLDHRLGNKYAIDYSIVGWDIIPLGFENSIGESLESRVLDGDNSPQWDSVRNDFYKFLGNGRVNLVDANFGDYLRTESMTNGG